WIGGAGKARRRGIVGAIPRRSNAASVVEPPPNLVTDFGFGTLGCPAVSGPPGDELDDAQRAVGERRGEGLALADELGAARIAPQAGKEAVAGGDDLGGALGSLDGPVAQRDLAEAEALERGQSLRGRRRRPAGDGGCADRLGAN